MQKEYDAHDGHNDAFLKKRTLEGIDGAIDQIGAIVDRLDGDSLGEPGRNLGNFLLDVLDDVERILAKARDGDAGNDFPFAIELSQSSALVRGELDARHVADQNRGAVVDLDHQVLDV